jgi:hypothetical protein
MKLLNKRAQVGNLAGFFMGIGVASIVLVVVMIILTELSTSAHVGGVSTGATTLASNATDTIITKLGTAPTWIGLIILAGLAFIVLGFFMGRRGA